MCRFCSGRSGSRSGGWRTCLIDVEGWQELVFSRWATSLTECDESWNKKKEFQNLNGGDGKDIAELTLRNPWKDFEKFEDENLQLRHVPVSQMLRLSFKSAVTDVGGRIMSGAAKTKFRRQRSRFEWIHLEPANHPIQKQVWLFSQLFAFFLSCCSWIETFQWPPIDDGDDYLSWPQPHLALSSLIIISAGRVSHLTLSSPISTEHPGGRYTQHRSRTGASRDLGRSEQKVAAGYFFTPFLEKSLTEQLSLSKIQGDWQKSQYLHVTIIISLSLFSQFEHECLVFM